MYKVTLELYIGEYEKSTEHLVSADNPEDAAYIALCDETHNVPLTRKQYDNGAEWWDDYMMYRVGSVVEVEC